MLLADTAFTGVAWKSSRLGSRKFKFYQGAGKMTF
jgi:hypothetical protein